jgi:poly-gamma-glutamate synthesis protein (capsule biosynthesis protein)
MTTRLVVLTAIVVAGIGLTARAALQPPARGPALPARELAMTVTDGFTLAAVGDTILAHPQSQNPDPRFQGALALVRNADVATANYEGNIIDGRTFKGSGPGGFAGTPDVAADLKAMGFDLVARSNYHSADRAGLTSLRSSSYGGPP